MGLKKGFSAPNYPIKELISFNAANSIQTFPLLKTKTSSSSAFLQHGKSRSLQLTFLFKNAEIIDFFKTTGGTCRLWS